MTSDAAFAREYLAEVKARTDLATLAAPHVKLGSSGGALVGLCPFHDDGRPSFYVYPDQHFKCHGCGVYGDAIGFVMRVEGLRFFDAVCRLAVDAGMMRLVGAQSERKPLAPRVALASPEQTRAFSVRGFEKARALWGECATADQTPVEAYWRFRGMRRMIPPTVRCHPALRYTFDRDAETGRWPRPIVRPAMVALVQNVAGKAIGVHRTWLRPDGRGKADVPSPKKMLGPCRGGACRLTPAARWLTIGEGIETTAAVLEAAPRRAAWAALSLGNIATIELPPTVKRLTLLRDAKGDIVATDRLLQRAAERFSRLGIKVEIASPPNGCGDFNDALRLGSTATARAAIKAALAAAEAY